MESVWSIFQEMIKNKEEMADEYRGLVIEQFECANSLKIAVEAIAKNKYESISFIMIIFLNFNFNFNFMFSK